MSLAGRTSEGRTSEKAKGLTQKQIDAAIGNSATQLPENTCISRCGSSKLNAAESLMQEAPPWKAALCMAWSSTALGVPRSARERLDCQDPGVNLPPILTAKEFGSELEIVRPRLCSGDADHRVAAER